MKLPSQNCTSYKDGKCLHQAVPRRLFVAALCILNSKPSDPRVSGACMLMTPCPRPVAPIVPPPQLKQ